MVLSESGVDLDNWRDEVKARAQPTDLKAFGNALAGSYIPNRCGGGGSGFCRLLQLGAARVARGS